MKKANTTRSRKTVEAAVPAAARRAADTAAATANDRPNGNGNRPRPKAFGPGWWEVFEGARAGNYRGWFFMPQLMLDSSRNINQWNRTQIASRSIWAYNNIPEVRAAIDGLAVDEVDTAIWPKAMTSNPAFNRAVTNAYHQENHDARSFDLRAVEDAYSAQFLIRRTLRLIGDLFGQLVRPFPDLYGRIAPRIGFIPGYQCTNDGIKESDEPDLREGIRFDKQTAAPTFYRFALPLRDGEEQKYQELPASDILHFHDPFLADQIRGMGTLAPVARQMYSMDDIDKAETSGQILRSRVAYAVETVGDGESSIPRLPGVTDTEVIENPDGTRTIIQKIRTRDGSEVDVITPPGGMKIKTLESNRGGAIDFRNFLARGLAHCTLYPPEWVLFISGLSQGTVARVVQNRVQKIATFFRNNQLVQQFVERWYIYWLWQRIKAGAFDKVEGGVPPDWFIHRLIFPRDLSVDLGRDGRLYDDRVMRGNETPRMYHGRNSEDDDDVDEELMEKAFWRRRRLAEVAAKPENRGIKIEFEEIWKLPPGTANVAAKAEVGADQPTDPATSTIPNNGNP